MTQPPNDPGAGLEWRLVPVETQTGNAKIERMIREQAGRRTNRLHPPARDLHERVMGRAAPPAEQVPDWGPESTWTDVQRHDAAKARAAFSRQLRSAYRGDETDDNEQDDEG